MHYSISQFAQETQLSAHTLRYYEKQQLLSPQRLPNGRRFYTEHDLLWIDLIKRLKETGMSIRHIQQFAKLRALGQSTYPQRMTMLQQHHDQVQKTVALWQDHLDKLNQKIIFYGSAIHQTHAAHSPQ